MNPQIREKLTEKKGKVYLIRCDRVEYINLATKRKRKLARIVAALDRQFRASTSRNIYGIGGNIVDDATILEGM